MVNFQKKLLGIIPFIQKEYDETIKWFRDTIAVANKEQDYLPDTDKILKENFFYCFNLCNFRNSCEYKKAAKRKDSE